MTSDTGYREGYRKGRDEGYAKGLKEAVKRHEEWTKWADKIGAPSEGRPRPEFIRPA